MRNPRTTRPSINSGSMADIAFLLLIFFLVTTTIIHDKGLLIKLPEKIQDQPIMEVHDRNIFKININSKDQIMVQGEVREDIYNLREEVKQFILNDGVVSTLSENPEKAIISLKTNRGTSYLAYIQVLDELQAAYFEIYAQRANMEIDEFRKLSANNKIYINAKSGIPMNISIAEPSN